MLLFRPHFGGGKGGGKRKVRQSLSHNPGGKGEKGKKFKVGFPAGREKRGKKKRGVMSAQSGSITTLTSRNGERRKEKRKEKGGQDPVRAQPGFLTLHQGGGEGGGRGKGERKKERKKNKDENYSSTIISYFPPRKGGRRKRRRKEEGKKKLTFGPDFGVPES